mgnify:CR=1 FL=1|tara:strand:+ start:396 stop:632 length:237 start_codon:yes stop_codon:yes gene_type:complete
MVDVKKVIIAVAVGCMFIFCFVRDIKMEDVAKEVVKAKVTEEVSKAKVKVDSVKAEVEEKVKKKFKLFKRLVPKKEAK